MSAGTKIKSGVVVTIIAAAGLLYFAPRWADEMRDFGNPGKRTETEVAKRRVELVGKWKPARQMKVDWIVGGDPQVDWPQGDRFYREYWLVKGTRVQMGMNEMEAFSRNAWKECKIFINGGEVAAELDDFGPPVSCAAVVK